MWLKADLHHHTSYDGSKTRRKGLSDYRKIIDELHNKEVNIIAITDHDSISFEALKKYDEYIKEKKYSIKVLPGVELGFKFKKNEKEYKGDLILIFDDKDIEQLEKNQTHIFSKYKKHCLFEEFGNIVNNLREKKIKFLSMPHFHKGAKNIDHKIFEKEYAETIIFFDFLEAKFNKPNDIELVKKAIDIIENGHNESLGTGIKKDALLGTDAHNFEDFKEKLTRIPWLYNIKKFFDLKKLASHAFNRIRFVEDKPFVVNKYIESIEYTDKNKVKSTLILSPGLNTIIGRRGTGKSYLVDQIANLGISHDKFEPDTNFKINFENLQKHNIKRLKQNILAETIQNIMKNLNENDTKTKISFKELGIEFEILKDFLSEIRLAKTNIRTDFKDLYMTNLNVVKENKKESINKFIATFLNRFLKKVKQNSNKKETKILNSDLKFMRNLKIEERSEWLKHEMETITQKLINFQRDNKYNEDENIKNVIRILKDSQTDLETTEKGKSAKIEVNSPIKVKKYIFSLIDNLNKIKEFVEKTEKKYEIHSRESHNASEHSTNVENLVLKIAYKIDEKLIFKSFFEEILKKIFTQVKVNSSEEWSVNKLLKLSYRTNSYDESSNFKIEYHYFLDNERLDDKSLGQQHERIINKVLGEDKDVFILDQPDDDLDSITIDEQIISKIHSWNFSKQIIVVTHDPKIVINADSQKIILANYKGDEELSDKDYKNIEEEDLKKEIHKIIDGKKRYPYYRYKRYGGYDDNK